MRRARQVISWILAVMIRSGAERLISITDKMTAIIARMIIVRIVRLAP